MKRLARIIRLRPGAFAEYAKLHAAVWPDLLVAIGQANIRNYSIHHWDDLLFSYSEYVGRDLERDMKWLAEQPISERWECLCRPLQRSVNDAAEDTSWMAMDELFFTSGFWAEAPQPTETAGNPWLLNF